MQIAFPKHKDLDRRRGATPLKPGELGAYCQSKRCAPTPNSTRPIRKMVSSRDVTTCPDCGYALIWTMGKRLKKSVSTY